MCWSGLQRKYRGRMEEAQLLKERLQAITNKRKIQVEIAQKRLEIDREKLKLQHVKKRSMRDLWLMDGMNNNDTQETQKALEDAQQTKLLKSNIHRIEKDIEALEREEMNISTNEGLILKRLKAIEKSPEEIIKAVNADFISETIHIHSTVPNMLKPNTPLLNQRKKQDLETEARNDQVKPALFAMEINVQKDLRTGESQVISTATISPQELQQRGIKVYDDGRKSVYALRTDGRQPGANGVDELSPVEVEELLRQASEKKKRSSLVQTDTSYPYSPSHGIQSAPSKPHRDSHKTNGYQDTYSVDLSAWPELVYSDSVHYPEDAGHRVPLLPMPNYNDRQEEYYNNSKGNSYGCELYRGDRHGLGQCYDPREKHRGALHMDSDIRNHRPRSPYSEDSKLGILNAMPSDEPVTMIFMGYQNAEEDNQSYEGSVRAELVMIGDGEDDTSRSFHPHLNSNINDAVGQGTRWKGKGDGMENPSATELQIQMEKLAQTA
ncbi:palmdelphin isoform X2 [Myxocyprinus asiaticus]|uniref:palmdelphin isoform X2 n=1 Tax=Myxocyprinus asiaticus TaxID=70543 RepID=UPI0022218DDB|nr:palmdelphin isoform X2 [Myxocyprinus asiaticus]